MKPQLKSLDKKHLLLHLFSMSSLLFLTLICNYQTRAQPAYHGQWVHSAGGHEVSTLPSAPVLDEQGNIYLATQFSFTNGDSLYFDDGTAINSNINNTVLTKYNANGQLLWAKSLRGSTSLTAIASDKQGGIYLLGVYNNSVVLDTITLTANIPSTYLAKFNSSGHILWARKVLDYSDTAGFYAMSIDPHGGIYLGGMLYGHKLVLGTFTLTNSDLVGGSGPNAGILSTDYVIAKYGQNGTVLWVTNGGKSDFGENINSITTDQFCHVYYGFNQQHAWDVGPNDTSLYYLTKCDTNGTILWVDTFRDLGINNMIADVLGNLYITGGYGHYGILDSSIIFGDGTTLSGDGIFTAKLKSNGTVLWGKASRNNPSDVSPFSEGIAIDKGGDVSVCGEYSNSITSLVSQMIFDTDTITMHTDGQFSWDTRDIFLVRYDMYGSLLEARSIGGNLVDENSGMVGTEDGNLYISGRYFSPSIDFDSITLTNNPIVNPDTLYYSKLYLAKYVLCNHNSDSDTTTAIQQIANPDFATIFPNPTTGMIMLKSTSNIQQIQIFNLEGRVIYHKELSRPTKHFQINLKGQANGVYWLKIQSKTGLAVKKIVLKH